MAPADNPMLKSMLKVCSLDPSLSPFIQTTKETLITTASQVCEQTGYRGCYNIMSFFLKNDCRVAIPTSVFRNAIVEKSADMLDRFAYLWFTSGQKLLKDTVAVHSLDSDNIKVSFDFYNTPVVHTKDFADQKWLQAMLGDMMCLGCRNMVTVNDADTQALVINDGLLERVKNFIGPAIFGTALKSYYVHEFVHTVDPDINAYSEEARFPYNEMPFFMRSEIKAYAMQVLHLKDNNISDANIKKILIASEADEGITLESSFAVRAMVNDFGDVLSGDEGMKRFQKKVIAFAIGVKSAKRWFYTDPKNARLLTALKDVLAKMSNHR